MNDKVKVLVEGLAIDPLNETPMVVLKDPENDKSFPIFVGYPEATAIAIELENLKTPRPMTHDLIKNILGELDVTVTDVLVSDLKNNTFYAIITLLKDDKKISIDARPSDAIALALRTGCTIYVSKELFSSLAYAAEDGKQSPQTIKSDLDGNQKSDKKDQLSENEKADTNDFDSEQVKKWIDRIKPSDFQ